MVVKTLGRHSWLPANSSHPEAHTYPVFWACHEYPHHTWKVHSEAKEVFKQECVLGTVKLLSGCRSHTTPNRKGKSAIAEESPFGMYSRFPII